MTVVSSFKVDPGRFADRPHSFPAKSERPIAASPEIFDEPARRTPSFCNTTAPNTLWASTSVTPAAAAPARVATCVTCHMADYADGTGGHTWWPSASSCTACHAGAADFDINGKQTEIQALLDTLRDLLLAQNVIEWVV